LQSRPPRPDERLDFLAQGTIVHGVLKRWWDEGGDIATMFEQAFGSAVENLGIPAAYHTERLHNAMRDDLVAFAADTQWPRAQFHSRAEEPVLYTLAEGIEIRGRIDRLDEADDGRAFVFDYKYSSAQSTRKKLADELLLQPPLYLMGAARQFGVTPAGAFYVGLKGGVKYVGWSAARELKSEPMPEDWFERTRELERCDCRDVCRIDVPVAAVVGA
jgi:ATP-dependent exoDNAse (exonuclease V) beta subunit